MMLDMLKYAAWVGVVLYAHHLFRKARGKGVVEGYAFGYRQCSEKVSTALKYANSMASLAEQMGEPMDANQYRQVLAQSLAVATGVHDAEQQGLL